MKVITGIARGCQLETLPGEDTRPTTSRVKEALFSAIQFDLEGRVVLDLFAGSGQLGIEALSRGAAGCLFVDKSPDAAAVIRRNLMKIARVNSSLSKNAQVLTADGIAFLSRSKDRFDAALLDPPYAAELLRPALNETARHMNPGGLIVCESDSDGGLPETSGRFRLARQYRYGRVRLWLYRWEDEPSVPESGY